MQNDNTQNNTYEQTEQKVLKPFVEGITNDNIQVFKDGINEMKVYQQISKQFIYSLIGGKSSVNRVKMSRVLAIAKPTITKIKRTFKARTLTNISKVNETLEFISFN